MRMHSKGRLLATAFAVVAALIASGAAEAKVTWTAYTIGPSDTLANVRGFKRIIAEIEKESKGEISVTLQLAGQLPIQSTNITQAIGEGIVQFGDDGFFFGNVPIAGILRLPMLLQNREEFDKAQKVMQPYVDDGFAKQGAIVLGHFVFPFQVAFSTKKLTTLDDFAGQKLRVSSAEQAAFVERFKGVPITMGAPEVPPALQRGTIDGVFTASAGGGRIWGDLLNYNYRLGVNYFNAVYIVNKKAFDGLSPDLQKIVRDVTERLAPATTDLIGSEETEVTDSLKAKGMTITEPTPDEIKRAAETIAPYWDKWAKERGSLAVEALAKVRQALGR